MGTLEKPTSGHVYFKGMRLDIMDQRRLATIRNQKMGFVFQFHHLLPEFNALENAAMPALIHGLAKKESFERAENILVRVGLGDRLKHRVGELSGGEQQRVAIARSLVLQPAVLLADEPTGNLDTKNSRKIHELLLLLNKELGITLIVVTHSKELADLMERCVTLVDGKMEEVTK